MDLLEKLNEMQRQAVQKTEGPLLLLAGAGSGKTRVLTNRIAYLIEEKNVKTWSILAITFTNKAAKEMKERVEDLIGSAAQNMWISTFHSMCVRILRRDIEKLGIYSKQFTIYDADDQQKVMKECLKELNYDDKTYPVKSMLGKISSQKNDLISVEQFEKDAQADFREEKIAKIYRLYQQKLQKNNSLDFDDLIFMTIELFKKDSNVLGHYQDLFKYIMVDEYQDTNTAQYMLVKLMAEKYRNLCVVGDDDQSIYKWRGANIRNILDFEKDFKEAEVIKLEQNYRSTKTILDAANTVISNNTERKAKRLWTENEDGETIEIFKSDNEHEEALYIANKIIYEIEENAKDYKDFAILYRTNSQSRVIEEYLVKKSIPYQLFGGLKFYARKEIKDILAYLKLIVNPLDDITVKRIINVPKRGIGDTSISKISSYASSAGLGFFEALTKSEGIEELKKISKKLKDFVSMVQTLINQKDQVTLKELFEKVLEETGYMSELVLENTDESKDRIQNINEFLSKVVEYQEVNTDVTLEGFLEEVALVADIDNYAEGSNSVKLMTLHSAKGLEFPTVFIAGFEDGIFPSYQSMFEEDELAEERRLCYVGITRAKKKLHITHATSRMLNGNIQYNKISRFLKEIPDELYSMQNGNKKQKIEKTYTNFKSQTMQSDMSEKKNFSLYNTSYKTNLTVSKDKTIDFVEGDIVQHKKFGAGTVESIKPAGADYEVTIMFTKFGVKKLMANLSNITKLK